MANRTTNKFTASVPQTSKIQRTTERGLNFVVVGMNSNVSGKFVNWPVLFLLSVDENGALIVSRCTHLDEYNHQHFNQSNQSRRETAQVIGLFIDYVDCATKGWSEAELTHPALMDRLVKAFAIAVRDGTIEYDKGTPMESMGLYWRPRGESRAVRLLARLKLFFEWLTDELEVNKFRMHSWELALKPYPNTLYRHAVAVGVARKKSFFAHLHTTDENAPKSHWYSRPESEYNIRAVMSFPSKYIAPLLQFGFTNRAGETDDVAQLCAFTLFLGGCRSSEPFQLFVNDVQFGDDRPLVFVHHPVHGRIRDPEGQLVTRKQYLQLFSRTPRNHDYQRDHAGFKGMLDENIGALLHWLPIPEMVALYGKKLEKYVFETRPYIMRQRHRYLADHPYLFVSPKGTNHSLGPGDPYSLSAFRDAWARAVKRVSIRYNDPDLICRKALGTTPHGARHHYGRFLITLGVPSEIIREAMHHKTVDAHKVYTRLPSGEINRILGEYTSLKKEFKERAGMFEDNYHTFRG